MQASDVLDWMEGVRICGARRQEHTAFFDALHSKRCKEEAAASRYLQIVVSSYCMCANVQRYG
jgi:hypothetical protein